MELDALKQLYQENAAQHDPSGFKLYHAAVDMTGFDLYSAFPYEDNRGMFEEADGHQLLRYLIADHFRAVEWAIVPGTCCERAALRDVDTTIPEYQAFEQKLYQKVLEQMGVITVETSITEINKDTFWTLIDQAKEHPGGPGEWLMEQLVSMGPEQAKKFDDIAHIYMDAAYQYGLWAAASVMERGGCSDDGFTDFRAWLVGQGKDVYMAALKDPDSLVNAPDYHDSLFDSLPYMGDSAYEELTGRGTYQDFDPARYRALKEELKKDIVYGEGIGYPYTWSETAAYLPKLCAKYMEPEELAWLIGQHNDTWNVTSPDIQEARRTALKSKKVQNRGDAR